MEKVKKKIVFLILHYNTIEDTIKCVESIKKNVNDDYHIVIVDNKSPNNSGVLLEDKYKDDKNISIILLDSNIGFARGNNVGFKFIKENFDTDYISMMNNDTYLLDSTFVEKIENEYKRSQFAVLGPKILLPNNKVNPVQKSLITKKQLKNKMIRMKIMYYCEKFYIMFLYNLFKKIFFGIFGKKNYGLEKNYNEDVDIRQENVVLHGAFLIFSKIYSDKFDGIDDRTFLYFEEKILYRRLIVNNMKSVYQPEIVIFHNEDSSTNSIMKNSRKKNMFIYKHAYNSAIILYNEL